MEMNNEPVAWTDHIGGFVDYGDDPNYPHPLYSHETVMGLLYKVAKLKAHPVKELTDEEISMNANELADELEEVTGWFDGRETLMTEAATMLRQQHSEIEALKAHLAIIEFEDLGDDK
jgi:hypothetical protein